MGDFKLNQPSQNLDTTEGGNRLAATALVTTMAKDASIDPNMFISTVMRQCFSVEVTKEQFLSFLMVANEYGLNPLTREIHGFAKGGRVHPIVGVDGWISLMNKHPQLDGIEYEDHRNETGGIEAITCTVHRKDREHPTRVTEYLAECNMNTEPWKKWPTRMLRHKATIQAARLAFGFSGIYDPDEAQRIRDSETDITGTATIITDEEPPQDAAAKIVGKLESPVDIVGIDVPADSQGAVGGDNVDLQTEEDHAAADDESVALEDIPGLKTGSETKAPPKKKADRADGKKPAEEQSTEEWLDGNKGSDSDK